MSGLVTPEITTLLEGRNKDGKNALFCAVELNRDEIIDFLLESYENLNLKARDTISGDCILHVACRTKNIEVVKKIFAMNNDLCMQQNFHGETPIFTSTQVKDEETLKIFVEYKSQALQKKDHHGENPLFECARVGNENIFNWFCGDNTFYMARGQQNYKGQTIEHIACINKQACIVDEIKPRPDTVDYYGNLPLYYTL